MISDGDLVIKEDASYKGRDVAIEEDHGTKPDGQSEPSLLHSSLLIYSFCVFFLSQLSHSTPLFSPLFSFVIGVIYYIPDHTS